MKRQINFLAFILTAILSSGQASAQLTAFGDAVLLPANPTSADNLKLSLRGRTCGGYLPYKANSYRVSMSQNNITVTLGERVQNPVPLCPPTPRDEIDLGRLPAGSYTLNLDLSADGTSGGFSSGMAFTNASFTIADARLVKTAPFVRLDYSGNWWDPNDPGSGLFIWHDARDNVLAAWFTYGADGKPIWYVFQPTWQTFAATNTAALSRTGRMPSPTAPPPNPTTYTVAGTASLDFTNPGLADEGKFTYTFTGGQTTVRNIQRFKP